MDSLLSNRFASQNLLCVLFIVYLVSGYKVPLSLARLINTTAGIVVVLLIAILLYTQASQPFLGILGFFIAYDLIRKSSLAMGGTFALQEYRPNEAKKLQLMTNANKIPYTLEQEPVDRMAPLHEEAPFIQEDTVLPITGDLHHAESI